MIRAAFEGLLGCGIIIKPYTLFNIHKTIYHKKQEGLYKSYKNRARKTSTTPSGSPKNSLNTALSSKDGSTCYIKEHFFLDSTRQSKEGTMKTIIEKSISASVTTQVKAPSPEKLKGQIQHYPWGNTGVNAFIPKLIGAEPSNQPWAELWLGIHPKAPTQLSNGESLLTRYSETQLPWLLKILDAKEMLSVQVHPNQLQAEAGFSAESTANTPTDQRNYKDPNPKPEIAIPLTEMWLMGGFLDKDTMVERFQRYQCLYEAFRSTIDKLAVANTCQEIKTLKESLYKQTCQLDQPTIKRLNAKLLLEIPENLYEKNQIEHWILKSQKKYPNDLGVFSFFMLNLIHLTPEDNKISSALIINNDGISLAPGEAFFTPPGIPHFYLEGACIEHMANSDNVLRAGFTSKHKDIDELLRIVDYSEIGLDAQTVQPIRTTPIEDLEKLYYEKSENQYFATAMIKHTQKNIQSVETTLNKPQVGLVLEGKILMQWPDKKTHIFQKGDAFLVPEALNKQAFSITSLDTKARYLLARTPQEGITRTG